MILILFFWAIIFFIFFVIGYSVVIFINKIKKQDGGPKNVEFDESFFIGFLTVSFFSGLLSIFIPIGNYVLFSVCIIAVSLFLINFRKIQINLKEAIKNIRLLNKSEVLLLSFIVIFILTAVATKITLGDTESYHVQSIQWIRKYAVVPGLGNIHGRLAFNSMFFVISALFTFQIRDILIFPINGLCYLVLIIKLVTLYKKEDLSGTKWKAAFYILTLLISLLIMIPDLNSPSPDIICGILIIYSFILVMNLTGKEKKMSLVQVILLNLVVFSCIAYKISSLFLVSIILLILNKDTFNRSLITISLGIIVLSSYFIRNFYLSGYVIYPFPGIDIFNVDWKIPLNEIISMKLDITSWAKISTMPAQDVVNMKFSEWIVYWFNSFNFLYKGLVAVNLFSLITFVFMLLKKDLFLARIQLIILINIFFWFVMAPDPRFAYGFIFLGFSLTFAYLIKLLEHSANAGMVKYLKAGLACLLILVICKRIKFPVDAIIHPSLWVISSPFETVDTKDYYSDFQYRVPVPEGGCYNAEIPCVPFPLSNNIVLRGKDLQDGFKTVKQ